MYEGVVQNLIDEFAKKLGFTHGASAEFRPRYKLIDDPGLKPLREAYLKDENSKNPRDVLQGPGGRPPGMFGGPGGMGQQRKLLKQFDKDGDGRLNNEERKAARAFLKTQGKSGFGPGKAFGFGAGGLAKPLLRPWTDTRDFPPPARPTFKQWWRENERRA